MSKHHGEHPRIGAVDVVPFVPVAEMTMDECAALARRLGERVGRELKIPVYLYEFAASAPHRRNLADVREGDLRVDGQPWPRPRALGPGAAIHPVATTD